MNNTFNLKRFSKVVAMDFRNIWPSFGLSMLIITLLPLAAWLLCMVISENMYILPEARLGFIYTCVLLTAMLAPSRLYKTCNLPKRGIYFAMIPASKFEKYLSMLWHSVIVCPLMVFVGGVVLDYLLALLPLGPYEQWITQIGSPIMEEITIEDLFSTALSGTSLSRGFWIASVIISFFGNAMTFVFTNTIFKKHKVVKTILWTLLISFVLQLVTTPWLLHLGLTNPDKMVDVLDSSIFHKNMYTFGLVMSVLYLALLLWWSGYRLRKMKY